MSLIKNSLLFIAAAAIAIATATTASASLLIEPHLGYNLYGNGDYLTTTNKFNGPQYGARFGAQLLGVMGGFDFTHSSYTKKSTTAAGVETSTGQKRDQFGIFAGYNLPILLRGWVGYYFTDKTTADDSTYVKGHGTELGVGFTGFPFLSINLQYRMSTYDKTGTTDLNPELKTKEVALSVSAPFTLL